MDLFKENTNTLVLLCLHFKGQIDYRLSQAYVAIVTMHEFHTGIEWTSYTTTGNLMWLILLKDRADVEPTEGFKTTNSINEHRWGQANKIFDVPVLIG